MYAPIPHTSKYDNPSSPASLSFWERDCGLLPFCCMIVTFVLLLVSLLSLPSRLSMFPESSKMVSSTTACDANVRIVEAEPMVIQPPHRNPFFFPDLDLSQNRLPPAFCTRGNDSSSSHLLIEHWISRYLAKGESDARLYRMLVRGMCGFNLTVVALGGSMTFGSFIPGNEWRFVHWVGEYLWRRFPAVPLVRAYTHGIPASASDIMSLCYDDKLGLNASPTPRLQPSSSTTTTTTMMMDLPDGTTGTQEYPSINHIPDAHSASSTNTQHMYRPLPVPTHASDERPVPDLVLVEYAKNDGYIDDAGIGETTVVDGSPNEFHIEDYSQSYRTGNFSPESSFASSAQQHAPPRFVPAINMERLIRAIMRHPTSAPMFVHVLNTQVKNDGCSFSEYYRDVAAYYSIPEVELTQELQETYVSDIGMPAYDRLAQSASGHFTPIGHRIQARFIESKIETHLNKLIGWLKMISQMTTTPAVDSERTMYHRAVPQNIHLPPSPQKLNNIRTCWQDVHIVYTHPYRYPPWSLPEILPPAIYASNDMDSGGFTCSTCWALPQCIAMDNGMNPIEPPIGWVFTAEPTAKGNFPMNKIGWTTDRTNQTIRLALPRNHVVASTEKQQQQTVIVSVLLGWQPQMGTAELQVEAEAIWSHSPCAIADSVSVSPTLYAWIQTSGQTRRRVDCMFLTPPMTFDSRQGKHTAIKLVPLRPTFSMYEAVMQTASAFVPQPKSETRTYCISVKIIRSWLRATTVAREDDASLESKFKIAGVFVERK